MQRNAISAEVPPLAISVRDFHTRFYPCSRAFAAQIIRSGELPSFRDGNRRMILFEDARAYVLRKAAAGGAIPPELSAAKSAAGSKGRAMQLEAATPDKAVA